QPELNRLSKQGRWDDMGGLISDDILGEFAVIGEPEQAVDLFKSRFGSLIDRTMAAFPSRDEQHAKALLARLMA
ncbi:MAG: hypothetical protein NZ777_18815, partial [Pseudomonadales bacterium]|nr:hypothetical protein [Pseudomonadales bacterium]